jgi:hypothetical protein
VDNKVGIITGSEGLTSYLVSNEKDVVANGAFMPIGFAPASLRRWLMISGSPGNGTQDMPYSFIKVSKRCGATNLT